jgi:S1-C subfamily serine protease
VLGVASASLSRHHGIVLPPETVDRVLDQLLAHGRVQQGFLGIAAQPVRAAMGDSAVDGLLVSSVAEDGPAARGGVLVGDVIVQVAGRSIASLDDLRAALPVGVRIPLQVSRGGQPLTLAVDVAERPQSRCQ